MATKRGCCIHCSQPIRKVAGGWVHDDPDEDPGAEDYGWVNCTPDEEHGGFEQAEPCPDQYLRVEECRSGQTWVVPISARTHLDLTKLVKKWIKQEFDGELFLDGGIMPRLQGDYYASIITDGHPPNSHVVWTSGGFYLKGLD